MPRPRTASCSTWSCWDVVTLESASAANRRTPGTASIRMSWRLLSSSGERMLMPVVLPPGRASDCTTPSPSMSSPSVTIGIVWVNSRSVCVLIVHIRCRLDDLSGQRRALFVAQAEATCHDCEVLPLDKSQHAQLIEERRYHRRIASLPDHDAKAIDMGRLLRARRERPRSGAADERYELAPLHSITSSARPSSIGGTVRPIVLAVFRLITSSNLVGCWTGRSPGFSPMKMR